MQCAATMSKPALLNWPFCRILENSANALATCGLVGLAKPWLDGGNNLHKIEQRGVVVFMLAAG